MLLNYDDLKSRAHSFLNQAATGNAEHAFSTIVGSTFVHHNPWFPAGAAALCAAMMDASKQCPDKVILIKNSIVDVETQTVCIHSHVIPEPNADGAAVVHLLRFEGGKLVELWDVGQAIEPADTVNRVGMF